jgi:esterase
MRLSKWLFLIAAWCFISCPANAEPGWPLPQGVKSIEVNGYDMAYQEAGSGAPIILVHGAVTDYRFWSAQVPEFAGKYHVIAVSLRHFYPEIWDGRGDDFSVDQHAADLAAFVKKLNLGKVHLLGHSRGGAVALLVAIKTPELIKSLILSDASGLEMLLPDTPENQKLAAEGRELRAALARNLTTGNRELASQVFVDSLIGPGAWSRRTLDQRQMTLDNLGTGLTAEERPTVTCGQVAKFDFPILLLNGDRSPRRYPEMFAAMRRCRNIPQPTIIPNGTHAMNRDNPPAFNAAVLDFLAPQQ